MQRCQTISALLLSESKDGFSRPDSCTSQFEQAQWAATQAEPGFEAVEYAGSKRSTVLRIVAATATHSGPEEAAHLTGDLLQVGDRLSCPVSTRFTMHVTLLICISDQSKSDHGCDTLQALQSFSLPMEAVATHMRAVAQLTAVSQAGPAWQRTLLADAEQLLSAYVNQVG